MSDTPANPEIKIGNSPVKPADLPGLFKQWAESQQDFHGLSYNSFKNYKSAVRTFIFWLCLKYPQMNIAEVTKEQAEQFYDWLGQNRYKASSIHVKATGMIRFWEFLQHIGVVSQNPFTVPKPPKRFGKVLRPFTEAEDRDFFKSIYNFHKNYRSHVVAMLLMRFAGLTTAEVFHLRPADIKQGQGGYSLRIRVRRGRLKPERTAILVPYFNPYGTDKYAYLDYVWNSTLGRNKRKPLLDIEKMDFIDFYTEMIEEGHLLKGFTPVRLRDTYVSWLSTLGATDLTISLLMGFKSPTSLKYYEEDMTAIGSIEEELLLEINQAAKYGGFDEVDGRIMPRNPKKANDQR